MAPKTGRTPAVALPSPNGAVHTSQPSQHVHTTAPACSRPSPRSHHRCPSRPRRTRRCRPRAGGGHRPSPCHWPSAVYGSRYRALPAMLRRLHAKPGAGQVTTTKGDMSSTQVEGRFDLVYLVFTPSAVDQPGRPGRGFRQRGRASRAGWPLRRRGGRPAPALGAGRRTVPRLRADRGLPRGR